MPENPSVAIEAARDALPAWVVWFPLLVVPVALALLAVVASLLILLPFVCTARTPEDAHWTERARRLYPLGRVATLVTLLLPTFAALVVMGTVGPLTPFPTRLAVVSTAVLVYAAAYATWSMVARLTPMRRAKLPLLLRSVAFDWFAFKTPLVVLLLELVFMPSTWSWLCLAVFGGAVALYLWLSADGCTRVLRALRVLRPADAALDERVRRVVGRRGPLVKAVFEADVHMANAAVFFGTNEVLVTKPARSILADSQLDAVLAHEAGHLCESNAIRWLRIASGALFLVGGLAVPTGGDYGVAAGLIPVFALLILMILLGRRLQKLELSADQHAHDSAEEGHTDHGDFALALERMSEHNLSPVVVGGAIKSHPDVYDRMQADGVEPGYKRPEPPARWVHIAALAVTVVVCCVIGVTLIIGQRVVSQDVDRPHMAIAVNGGAHWAVSAMLHSLASGDARARLWSEYVLAVGPDDVWSTLSVARYWSGDDPAFSRETLDRAIELAERYDWGNWWLDLEIAGLADLLGATEVRDAWIERARADATTEGDRAVVDDQIALILGTAE